MLKCNVLIYFFAVYLLPEISSKFFEKLIPPKLHISRHPIKKSLKDGKENPNKSLDKLEKSIMKNIDSINVMFDPKALKFVPSRSKKPHILGGLSQNSSDPSDVEKSKYEKAVRYLQKLNNEMIIFSTKINRELERYNYSSLNNFIRASALLKESLATMHSLDVIRNDQPLVFSKYTLDWYTNASLKEKYQTEKNIERALNNLFVKEVKKKKNVKARIIDENIKQLETDLLVQRLVNDSIHVTKLLKEHNGGSTNYMSPMHSDVCGQLGNVLVSFMFEKVYKKSINNDLGYFKKFLPRLKFRINSMVHNGTLILLEKELDEALHSFKLKTAELMEKKFGFVDMCSHKCVDATVNAPYYLDEYKGKFKESDTLQRRADLIKIIMYYYRDKLYNIETASDLILIMLLYLNSATELTEKGFIDISSISTSDKFNLLNTTIDRKKKKKNVKKNKKQNFLKIAPFNFFREEPEERSGNEAIFAIDDIIKTCLLAKTSQNFNYLFEMTKELWNNIQNIYSASYGFVSSRRIKTKRFVTSKIRNVGFIFRWFNYNKKASTNTNFLVHNFSPLISINLQLTFFIRTMIEQYESSFLSNFSSNLKKIFTLGKSSAHPRNYNDLVNFSETDYLLRYSKADKVQRIISQLVKMLKKKFLSIPYTPTLLAQYISLFLSLWVFENEEYISLQNPNVSRFKKLFFLSYFIHNSGPLEKAVEIIYDRCKRKTSEIVLGCIDDYGGIRKKKFLGIINRKCKATRIPIRKPSIRKVLKVLMPSLSDPLDIIKIAVDTATRCEYFSRGAIAHNNTKKQNKINYDVFVKSELSLRYICANVTKNIVKKIIKDVSRLKNMSESQNLIQETLNSLQYLKIRNYMDKESSISIFCPFMEGNDKQIRDLERDQISFFVHKNVGLLKILKGKIMNVFKKSITTREGIKPDSAISLKVGGNFIKHEKIKYKKQKDKMINNKYINDKFILELLTKDFSDTLHIGLSKNRKVYNGREFVDELEILRPFDVKRIVMKGVDEENERFYVLSDNTQISEFDYAIVNPSGNSSHKNMFIKTITNIVIYDGNNYISAFALRDMGLQNERIVWAGYSVGWVAEFALSSISEKPLPIFDGYAWVLLEKLSIKSILGDFLPRDVDGNLLANTVNFIILNKDGKQILKNTTPVINLKHATFTLNGILNFVTKAEKGKGNEIIVHTRIP
ncbi:rhoptry neck protein 5 [Plasmodium malariae]|uniref:Rhoptry neck protein 5 n=2 Tax=Plasmodium malariae TaxID=5858 RepID=A0A1D3JLW6_PLAMA|nr:rhoptry neck protein 5 [Plasmodium malariae]SBT87463.1 rhoptry neck protein 5 [Plasmodium malariae]